MSSIFTSAFLLFEVQPMILRYILPFLGGTPAVWSTVQPFFQILLTSGYAYAFWLISRISAKIIILGAHLYAVDVPGIGGGLGFLWPSPITPGASGKPTSADTPVQDIFKLLHVTAFLQRMCFAIPSYFSPFQRVECRQTCMSSVEKVKLQTQKVKVA